MSSTSTFNETETVVFNNIVKFCKCLEENHFTKWNTISSKLKQSVIAIYNLSERYRGVTRAKLYDMPNFKEVQACLMYDILDNIEQDFLIVKENVDALSRCNSDLKAKLEKLEQSSCELDWDIHKSDLIYGCPQVPPVEKILSYGLDYYVFFNNAYKNIYNCTRNVQWSDEKSVELFQQSFNIDFDDKHINYIIAILQYVDENVEY